MDAMAKAIEDALAALELKPVDNPGTNNTTQGTAASQGQTTQTRECSQSGANNANQGGAQSGANNASPSVEQSENSDTSQPDTSDVSLADTKSEVEVTPAERIKIPRLKQVVVRVRQKNSQKQRIRARRPVTAVIRNCGSHCLLSAVVCLPGL